MEIRGTGDGNSWIDGLESWFSHHPIIDGTLRIVLGLLMLFALLYAIGLVTVSLI